MRFFGAFLLFRNHHLDKFFKIRVIIYKGTNLHLQQLFSDSFHSKYIRLALFWPRNFLVVLQLYLLLQPKNMIISYRSSSFFGKLFCIHHDGWQFLLLVFSVSDWQVFLSGRPLYQPYFLKNKIIVFGSKLGMCNVNFICTEHGHHRDEKQSHQRNNSLI